MPICIYCKEIEFENKKGSEEHVILSSIGGKKKSRNVCCQSCNGRLGKEIDEPLSKELSFFSTMFGIITGRDKDAPTQKRAIFHEGKYYDIKPGGNLQLSRLDVNFSKSDNSDQEIFSITGRNTKEILEKLNQVLRKYNKSIDDFPELKATYIKSFSDGAKINFCFGGKEQSRSIAKMLLTYLATMVSPETIRNGQFETIINFINKGDNDFNSLFYDSLSPLPEKPMLDEINHRIFIFASQEKKLVFGVLELFGYLKFSAILTDKWNGKSFNKVYVVNSTTGEQVEKKIDTPDKIFDFIDQMKLDSNHLKNQIDKLFESFQERQTMAIISNITKTLIGNHLKEGEIMTPEVLKNLASELSLEWVKFKFRIPSEENIDLR